jgi:mannose-1-phosphate guanylyltransferase
MEGADARGERWGLLLAGGDGTRLRSLTRMLTGDDRPKQFCRVMGGETLLEQTLRRALLAVPRGQVMAVVTEQHERFYKTLLRAIGIPHVVSQPQNRGTALGILYPLLRLAELASDATVAIFPSDHHFSDDRLFAGHVDSAFRAAEADPTRVFLLGIIPTLTRRSTAGSSQALASTRPVAAGLTVSVSSGKSRMPRSPRPCGSAAVCGTASS